MRNSLCLAACQAEAGKVDDAAKGLQAAYDLAGTAGLADMQKEVAALQVGGRMQGAGFSSSKWQQFF